MSRSLLYSRYSILALAAVLLAGYLLTGVVLVRPGERAVVSRFGRMLDHKPGPGLWIGLPWGIDRVDRIEVDRVRRVEVGYVQGNDDGGNFTPPGQLLTGDHNLVNVQVAIDYTVRDAEVDSYAVQKDRVESLVARSADAVLADWVGGQTVDEVLVSGKSLLPRLLVARTQERLEPLTLGIQVRSASVLYLARRTRSSMPSTP